MSPFETDHNTNTYTKILTASLADFSHSGSFATEPEEDIARLSPLLYAHLNVLEHYSFTLAEQISKGKL